MTLVTTRSTHVERRVVAPAERQHEHRPYRLDERVLAAEVEHRLPWLMSG